MTSEQARSELGVPSHASPSDIRRAFKQLALRHHPDRNGGHEEASGRFRRLLMAYEILSGQRPPATVAATPAATVGAPPRRGPDRRPPWAVPFVEALPIQSPDGAPLHYPTAEEIRKLDLEDPVSPRKMMGRFFLVFLGFVAFCWLLALLDHRPPAPIDPIRQKLRKSLSW